MEPKFNTSFIPKKSLQADTSASGSGPRKYVGRRQLRGPFFYFTLLLFVVSLIVSVGVFGYTTIVDQRIQEKKKNLHEKKKAFEDREIEGLMYLDKQLKGVSKLLAEHIALSQMFDLLEAKTLKRIQYLELTYDNKPESVPSVTITGKTDSYQYVAQQSNVYREIRGLYNPIVRDLERKEEDFSIEFTIVSSVDDMFINYSTALKEGRLGSGSTPSETTTPTPPTPTETGDSNPPENT